MKKIMIIDDEEPFTRLCKMNLEMNDAYYVTIVNDPHDALYLIGEVRPDLIFLDVIMPGINGPDLAAQILDDESMRDIPIIFLSASVVTIDGGKPLVDTGEGTFKPLRNELLHKLPVIEKPVTPEQMVESIEAHT